MVMRLSGVVETVAVLLLLLLGLLVPLSSQQQEAAAAAGEDGTAAAAEDTPDGSGGLIPPFFPLQREPVDCFNDLVVFNITGHAGDDVTRATCVKRRYAVDFCCPRPQCRDRTDCQDVVLQDSFALALDACWLRTACQYRTCSSFQPRCLPENNLVDFTSTRVITEATSVLRLQQSKADWRRQSYACGVRSVFGWPVPVRTVLMRRDGEGTAEGDGGCARVGVAGDGHLECDTRYVTVTKATPFNVTVDVSGVKPYDVDVYALLLSDRGDVEVTCFGAVSTLPPVLPQTPDPGSSPPTIPTSTEKSGGGALPPTPPPQTPGPDVTPSTPAPTSRDKGGNSGENDEQTSMDNLPIFIVAAVVLVIALIVAAIVVCMLRRKGMVCRSKGNNSGGPGMSRAGESGLHLQPTSSLPQESIYYSVDGEHSYADRSATPQYDAVEWSIPTAPGRAAGPMYFRLRTDDPTPPAVGEADPAYFTVEPERGGSAPPGLPVGYRRTPNVVQPGGKGPYAVTQLPRDPASFHGDLGCAGFQARGVPAFSSLGRPGGGPGAFVPIDPPDPPLPCRGPPEFSSRHFSEGSSQDPPYHSIRDSDVVDSLRSAPSTFDRQQAGGYDRQGGGGPDRQLGLHAHLNYDRETAFDGGLAGHERRNGSRADYDRHRHHPNRDLAQDRPSTFGRHVGSARRGDYERQMSFDRPTTTTDRESNGRRPSTEAKPSSFQDGGDRGFGNGVFSQAVRSPTYEPQVPRQGCPTPPPPVPANRADFSVKYKRGR